MKRNPVNVLNDEVSKILQIAKLTLRTAIHSSRAKKFGKIDLRKYKSRPKDKKRIRAIIYIQSIKVRFLLIQMMIETSQPIPRFEPGTEMIGEISRELIVK